MTTNCSQGAGFYKRNTAGNALIFSSVAVHFPGGSSIEVAKHAEYEYPVNGWTYYESKDAAYATEHLDVLLPGAERMAARKVMTKERRNTERADKLQNINQESSDPKPPAKPKKARKPPKSSTPAD